MKYCPHCQGDLKATNEPDIFKCDACKRQIRIKEIIMFDYIVVDQYAGGITFRISGISQDSVAAEIANKLGLSKCLSPKLILAKDQNEVGPVFVDEATREGWGRGCPFDGQTPKHQVCFVLIKC
jgi:DNA-directed RNA polymerase subunit M/transcription elongation factor TFIIS